MKFKSHVGKQVMISLGIFTFTDEIMETEDPAIIERLLKAADVEQVKEGKKEKADKDE